MDISDQRFLDSLLQRHDYSAGISSSQCEDLQSLAGQHILEAGRFLGVVGQVVASQVAEIPNDIVSLVTGSFLTDDYEGEEEDEREGGKDFARKRVNSPVDVASVFLVTGLVDACTTPTTPTPGKGAAVKEKARHVEVNAFIDSPYDAAVQRFESDNSQPSPFQRKFEDSMFWAMKNKRE